MTIVLSFFGCFFFPLLPLKLWNAKSICEATVHVLTMTWCHFQVNGYCYGFLVLFFCTCKCLARIVSTVWNSFCDSQWWIAPPWTVRVENKCIPENWACSSGSYRNTNAELLHVDAGVRVLRSAKQKLLDRLQKHFPLVFLLKWDVLRLLCFHSPAAHTPVLGGNKLKLSFDNLLRFSSAFVSFCNALPVPQQPRSFCDDTLVF